MHRDTSSSETTDEDTIYAEGDLIGDRWIIMKPIGKGNNGFVFSAYDVNNSKAPDRKEYALKIQQSKTRSAIIENEINFYQLAKNVNNVSRTPLRRLLTLHDFGFNHNGAIYFVVSLANFSLDKLVENASAKKLEVVSSLQIGRQALSAIGEVHRLGYAHRNVKPSNFALEIRPNGAYHLYIIDFERVRLWSDKPPAYGQLSKHDRYSGPLLFASLNGHMRRVLGRHDDLQSWLYVLAYMTSGRLPWFGSSDKNVVGGMKLEAENNPRTLYELLPTQIWRIRDYIRLLGFDDQPNYGAIIQLIDEALANICPRVATQPAVDV